MVGLVCGERPLRRPDQTYHALSGAVWRGFPDEAIRSAPGHCRMALEW